MRTSSKASVAALGVLAASVALAACGSSTPKPKATIVDGVSLTAAGTKLAYGASATVLAKKGSVASSPVAITVKSIKTVPAAQLARYGVATLKPPVRPYYVYVAVKNVGKRDIGGAAIPLYLQDSKNVLVNSSPIRGKFPACPSQPLPKSFGAGASVSTCLIYLLPATDPAVLVSYRPVQTVEAITWSGSIAGQSPSASPSK